MSEQFQVDVDSLEGYARSLDDLQGAFDALREYAVRYGCDKSGFTGLLALLHPGVDLVGTLFGETLNFGQDRLGGTADGIRRNAEVYAAADQAVQDRMVKIMEQANRVI
ncbi:hypothetical protein C1701_07480 [Actinoalloteichus sp. AHMU CJ021]|uniref:Uncharacterized protein n=1 Tax=Actinoalloteichus caeruleus DSM 43889 TaxID=1120930 RepID=A0ABT1JJ06_ACTCY|nr:hypothetical protein [Actinoalloteichus caeruleus]AUS78236.1 hypothetical protein C1701_07480 [Actinoalloteichus sp. AHMU CJ021]MCP2332282.1 hypothetical protein [Actinoalloteichus caeruleus DSM 43889]